jgi:hypothetical protein
MKLTLITNALTAAPLGIVLALTACDRPTVAPPPPLSADGTRDETPSGAKTPIDQSESSDDIRITAEIRRLLIEDPALSVDAKNCKVITDGGEVTLRGVVASDTERTSVESKAKTVAGVATVVNHLEVRPAA